MNDHQVYAIKLALLQAQVAEQSAEIAALRAQVAELEAWKDAVPVLAINALHYEAGGGMITQSQDDDIREWLFAVMQK